MLFLAALSWIARSWSGQTIGAAIRNVMIFGFPIRFLVWSLFISFVTAVQHTSPRPRWILPTGRPSTHEQKLRGTLHIRFLETVDWFLHRVIQHIVHHVYPTVPLYRLKAAEMVVTAKDSELAVFETWTPAYHWRLTRRCKLYDPVRDAWCSFDAARSGEAGPMRRSVLLIPMAREGEHL